MRTIQKILFPTDFSETAKNAFRYCIRLADEYNASIHLLHVIYPEFQVMDTPIVSMQATQDKAKAAREILQSFVDMTLVQVQASHALKHIPPIHSQVEIGDAVSVITKIARMDNADLIVMGTRNEHDVLDRFFGSMTTGVIERAHCPVWVVPEEAHFDKLDVAVYATDLQEANSEHIWQASQLLEPFHPTLHCVHVSNNGHDSQMSFQDIERFFAMNAPALKIQFHQLEGKSVADSLEDFSQANHVDVLIMYAPHHNLIERIFYPSETKRMALNTRIPLLLYKTE